MRILLIDHYDSFTAILAQMVQRATGIRPEIVKSDRLKGVNINAFHRIILSPGPGLPSDAPGFQEVIDNYSGKIPILGICLGHQSIAESYGGRLTQLPDIAHGQQSRLTIINPQHRIYNGLDSGFLVGRYHSWVINPSFLPDCLEITAVDEMGNIMSVQHKNLDIHGVQFHPESYMSENGIKILKNFVQ